MHKLFRAVRFKLLFTRKSITTQNTYTYHCHNTKHVHVPLSQYKTCTRTAVTIQNMYTYRCHNTKHVHVPVTMQNMYTYRCHNTKHVHVPLSQYKTRTRTAVKYKTCTRTTVTIQNMYTYHCQNTKHVHIPLGTANTNAYSQNTSLLGTSRNHVVETSNFAVDTWRT